MASQSEVQSTDLLDEELVPPADGIKELTGKRPSPSSCWRWISKGLRGHKLESVKVLGRTYSSLPAIRRWLTKVESSRIEAQAASRSDGTGERSESTQRELEAAGLV